MFVLENINTKYGRNVLTAKSKSNFWQFYTEFKNEYIK